jgi:hypothetical protein
MALPNGTRLGPYEIVAVAGAKYPLVASRFSLRLGVFPENAFLANPAGFADGLDK